MLRLFEALKVDIISSPIIVRYDQTKPCFLKKDWISITMYFVLIQLDNSVESAKAIEPLITYTYNNFDRSMPGARLQPVVSRCRLCTDSERHRRIFIG